VEEIQSFLPQNSPPVIDWIEDEDLLRDEGILFGLSEADVSEKTEVIRSYFATYIAPLTAVLQSSEQKQIYIEKQITEKQTEKLTLKEKKLALLQIIPTGNTNLPRTIAGLLLALAICVCNFYLILQVMAPHFAEPVWVASGVFLAGMFSLFSGSSYFFTENQAARSVWKMWLEELLVPLAATFFVSVWAFKIYPPFIAFAFSFFVLALFLISGKILLSTLTTIKVDFSNMNKERHLYQVNTKLLRECENELLLVESQLQELLTEKEQLPEKNAPLIAQIAHFEARRDMLVKLFESEFYLSRGFKANLTDKQKLELTSFKMKKG
jgi:hypothetical protein